MASERRCFVLSAILPSVATTDSRADFREALVSVSMIQIGELSRRTGCNIETIRFYERAGVMALPQRRGRYRSYSPEDIGRLTFIRRARELGFTLDEVRA